MKQRTDKIALSILILIGLIMLAALIGFEVGLREIKPESVVAPVDPVGLDKQRVWPVK